MQMPMPGGMSVAQAVWLHILTAVLAAAPPTLVALAMLVKAIRSEKKTEKHREQFANGELRKQIKDAVLEAMEEKANG
jgi:hypothetical protein